MEKVQKGVFFIRIWRYFRSFSFLQYLRVSVVPLFIGFACAHSFLLPFLILSGPALYEIPPFSRICLKPSFSLLFHLFLFYSSLFLLTLLYGGKDIPFKETKIRSLLFLLVFSLFLNKPILYCACLQYDFLCPFPFLLYFLEL